MDKLKRTDERESYPSASVDQRASIIQQVESRTLMRKLGVRFPLDAL